MQRDRVPVERDNQVELNGSAEQQPAEFSLNNRIAVLERNFVEIKEQRAANEENSVRVEARLSKIEASEKLELLPDGSRSDKPKMRVIS